MQVHKTNKAIAAVITSLTPDAVIEVTLKPITDRCWLDDENNIVDAAGDNPSSTWLTAAVRGTSVRARVDDITDGMVLAWTLDEAGNKCDGIDFRAEHLRSLAVVKTGPLRAEVDGLRYTLEFQPDGSLRVGCQTITPKGCEQAFRALAAHLGYDVEE